MQLPLLLATWQRLMLLRRFSRTLLASKLMPPRYYHAGDSFLFSSMLQKVILDCFLLQELTYMFFILYQSMIGHCLGAAGGLEAIATVKAITTGWLHPTINQFVRLLNIFRVKINLTDCMNF